MLDGDEQVKRWLLEVGERLGGSARQRRIVFDVFKVDVARVIDRLKLIEFEGSVSQRNSKPL